jgi:hypothetical protein
MQQIFWTALPGNDLTGITFPGEIAHEKLAPSMAIVVAWGGGGDKRRAKKGRSNYIHCPVICTSKITLLSA